MIRMWLIAKNIERYGDDLDRKMPSWLSYYGTLEQARELAACLSNWVGEDD